MASRLVATRFSLSTSPSESTTSGSFPWGIETLLLACTLIIGLVVRLAFGPHVREDAYITLRYANHLATSLGFTFNDGERVLGTTTPLYALLLAALGVLGVQVYDAALSIGIVADIGVMVLLWYFSRQLISPYVGILASLTYALLTPTVVNAVSGMETSLYLFFILLTFVFVLRGNSVIAGALCGITVLIRPDGLLVPVTLVLYGLASPTLLVAWHRGPRAGFWKAVKIIRHQLLATALFGIIVIPWVVFAWRYFGSPIPQSMVAKWSAQIGDGLTSVHYLFAYFTDTDVRWFLPLTLLAVVGLVFDLRFRRASIPLYGWSVLYTVAFVASNKFVYPLAPFEWYFLPLLLPFSVAVAAGGLRVLTILNVSTARLRSLGRVIQFVTVFLSIYLGLVHLQWERVVLDKIVGGREVLYLTVAQHLQGRYGVSNETLASPEIGALGFAYPGPILDLSGLVTPTAVGKSVGDVFDTMLHGYKPQWVVLYGQSVPDSSLSSEWFQSHYRPVFSLRNWESRDTTLYRWYPAAEATSIAGPKLGDGLELVGRRVSSTESDHARRLHVELVWRAGEPMASRRTISVQAFDQFDVKLGQQDNEPQEDSRPTTTWKSGDVYVDQYDLLIDPKATTDPQWLSIGGYLTESSKESLRWVNSAGNSLGSQLFVPIISRSLETGSGSNTCDARFANGIILRRVDLGPNRSDRREVTLHWDTSTPSSVDYTVFVHAMSANGDLIAQSDGQPLNGRMPTSTWVVSETFTETRTVVVDPTKPISSLQVGLYEQATGQRLRRADSTGDSVIVSTTPEVHCS